MTFDEQFKIELKRYMQDNFINPNILASKAGINKHVFTEILNNTSRKVYGDEVAGICNATGLTLKEILKLNKKDNPYVSMNKSSAVHRT
ncbi:hypothetical protein BJV85_002437 [Clostridium acetobutylicum]|uniref:HTH cro/C1-type domain-containing protein n=1 Tax=Clostridium acetobutylicum (strain ATCC 824 / DSM 792 / JCM 1419 / IAM 19013 / LMG 5710 / NBRC 13948 / NRRL B-527 / VKM B-1787 / 2291 / W) TaxID=272562 RepID=Q97IT0_CLOAB|nr:MULTISPECIES: helix-turn-helix transcriptional regulator [Clostridium]AAK79527.1 Hypothetical protein CA_C1560 [Clostridium acetobutylicum ATCC 824]ADZ20612.1 Conserved hypothetical protein [Clostridium acetobutylicum EA 2018]AEI31869.1 hypothetical protein SMB_G1585 [Clostridium acetobutylicum DSM 1731]AWV81229.1 XRE family transcriptional regulator [Clostridium acetobutylicum]KHD36299.1 hypothetical protein NL50_11070 [Clostridium acetobutylicum]